MDAEAINTRRDTTPPEIWRAIISYLPRETARECLLVSRMFHAFAVALLFSTLRLRFGSWQVEYGFTDEPPEEDSACRSCCILLRIIADPVFASYVKHLQIIAFPGHDAAFEICWSLPLFCCMLPLTSTWATGCLTRAIGCLHNLRTLEWRTHQYNMIATAELLETLVGSCSSFERLVIP